MLHTTVNTTILKRSPSETLARRGSVDNVDGVASRRCRTKQHRVVDTHVHNLNRVDKPTPMVNID